MKNASGLSLGTGWTLRIDMVVLEKLIGPIRPIRPI